MKVFSRSKISYSKRRGLTTVVITTLARESCTFYYNEIHMK